jgi:hypothetical protein
MGAIREYKLEFPKRTIHLLNSFRSQQVDYKYDVTLMMNCLLGLIVVAVENSDRDKLMPGKVDDGLLAELPHRVKIKRGKNGLQEVDKDFLKSLNKLELLQKIRNGIAHQNITGLNENGIWAGIKLWNIDKAGDVNFEMRLSTEQLYNLATYISRHYFKKLDNKKHGKA